MGPLKYFLSLPRSFRSSIDPGKYSGDDDDISSISKEGEGRSIAMNSGESPFFSLNSVYRSIKRSRSTPRYLEIDGGRYLGIGSGTDNYYISNHPQLIQGERIPIERVGLRVFKIDRGDSDYFDLVALGIIISDEMDDVVRNMNDAVRNMDDVLLISMDDVFRYINGYGNTWVGGDKILFDEISKKIGLELEEGREIVCLPPFVFKYPKHKLPKHVTLERLVTVFLHHAIRLCVDMRRAAGISRTETEKFIHPVEANLRSDGETDESETDESEADESETDESESSLETDSNSNTKPDSNTMEGEGGGGGCLETDESESGLETDSNSNTKPDSNTMEGEGCGGCLELHGHRYLAIDRVSGKYCISKDAQPIKGGQRIPTRFLGVRMFKIDHGGDCFDLLSLGILWIDDTKCVCGDRILLDDVMTYIGIKCPMEEMRETVYVPPFVVKYPKNMQPIVMKRNQQLEEYKVKKDSCLLRIWDSNILDWRSICLCLFFGSSIWRNL